MKKLPIITTFIFFLLVVTVFAVPPQTFIPQSESLQIAYPKFDEYKFGEFKTLHFHVYNASGYLMTNESVDCFLHVYDIDGHHIVEDEMLFCGTNKVDFEYELNSSIINRTGTFTYIIWCNNSYQGGFSAAQATVVKNFTNELILPYATGVNDSSSGISVIIFLLVISGGLILLSFKELSDGELLDMILRRSCIIGGTLLFMLNASIVQNIALSGGLRLGDTLLTVYAWGFGKAAWLFIFILFFKTLLDGLNMWKFKKNKDRWGDD